MTNEMQFQVGDELEVVDADSLLFGRTVKVVHARRWDDGSVYYVCSFRRLNGDGTEAEEYGSGMFEPEMLARGTNFTVEPDPEAPGKWRLFVTVRVDGAEHTFVNAGVFSREADIRNAAEILNGMAETCQKAKTALFDGSWRAWTKVER